MDPQREGEVDGEAVRVGGGDDRVRRVHVVMEDGVDEREEGSEVRANPDMRRVDGFAVRAFPTLSHVFSSLARL
jgi:hypothetical protein